MTKPIWFAAMFVVGLAITGLILVGGHGGDPGVGKRETLTLLEAQTEDDDDAPTNDKTRDTHAGVNSALSRDRLRLAEGRDDDGTNGDRTGGTRDASVRTAPTSHATRGTVSGGAGIVDTAPTSGVTHGTASGGAGTHDGGGGTGSGGGTTG